MDGYTQIMLAFLAAVCFGIQLVVQPAWHVNLVVLGFLFLALHLAVGTNWAFWRR